MTTRKPTPRTTDETPVTVRLPVKTWAVLFLSQLGFISSVLVTGAVWAGDVANDIDNAVAENTRQNDALAKLTEALEKVADNSNQTARTLERVMGRLEMEEKR